MRTCRLRPHGETVAVQRRDKRAGYSGLVTCGSVWACPCCSAKIQSERTDELTRALTVVAERGWRVAMVTLTMRHRRGQALAELWDALSPAWAAALTTDRRVQRAKRRAGVQGWVRRVEATHGENGWHLHVHALVFFNGDPKALDELRSAAWAGWLRRLGRAGFDADERVEIDLRELSLEQARGELARYLNKVTYESAGRAARELAGQLGKRGRRGTRTPFDVLADLTAIGEADDLAIWREWEQASRGRRAITWSDRGKLRKELLADEPERTDEEIAEATDGLGETVALLTRDPWGGLVVKAAEPGLLAAVERAALDPYEAVAEYVAALGLPPPLRPPPAGDPP
ncbi:MAG: protein rep [Solirubrobacteraceae bacterium]